MKMRFSKKIFIITSLLVFVLSMAITAYAAGEKAFLQDYDVKDGKLQLSLAASDEEGGYTKDGFSITISGQNVPVTDMKTVDEIGAPVTIYCLVDVSSSMTEMQMAWIKQMLGSIAQGMKPGDNIAIATLGNTTNNSGFMMNPTQIEETINGLAVSNEDTNLYAGIVDSLDLLNKDKDVHPNKCLVILSDGQDDQKSGITQSEAENAVKKSDIPVYTVAVLMPGASGQAIEYGKLLGSFARMSTGGVHYAPDLAGESAEETAGSIWASMKNGIVLYVDASDVNIDKDVMLLRAIYTSADGSQYEDTMDIYGEDLKKVVKDETDTSDDTEDSSTEENSTTDNSATDSSATGTDTDKESSDDKDSKLIYFIIGGVALLIVIIIIIAVSAGKKKKRKASESDSDVELHFDDFGDFGGTGQIDEIGKTVHVPKNMSVPVAPSSLENMPETGDEAETAADAGGHMKTEAEITSSKQHVLRLHAIGYENIEKIIKLVEGREITVGRTDMADIILMAEDKRLSNVHCKICWEAGKLYVSDADSTNGTFVNGVPIKQMGRVVVHEGDTIRVGSYEYRVG